MSEENAPSSGEAIFMFVFGVLVYFALVWNMFRIRDNEISSQQNYIHDHHCKLTETIPSRSVGMMIHGESYVYTCPNGEKVQVN